MRQGDNDTVVGERTAKQMRWYWNALMRVEREKELFRRDLLETMWRFRSKRMREVVFVGTVKRRWMEVVAGVMGVRVRAQLLEAGRDEWVVVEPEVECPCKKAPWRFDASDENLGGFCCPIPWLRFKLMRFSQ